MFTKNHVSFASTEKTKYITAIARSWATPLYLAKKKEEASSNGTEPMSNIETIPHGSTVIVPRIGPKRWS